MELLQGTRSNRQLPADVLMAEGGSSRFESRAKWRRRKVELDIDGHFGNVVALSLKALPVEERPRARAAILQCIAEFRECAVGRDSVNTAGAGHLSS